MPRTGSARRSMIVVGVCIAAACGVAAILFATNLASNLWLLTVEPANHIPRESSVWTFDPTVVNDGSSNYWIYGEDSHNYYYFPGEADAYSVIARADADRCTAFVSTDYRTWCRT